LIILSCLLGTITPAVFTRSFHSLRIWREQFNDKNMRPGLRDRRVVAIGFQELGGPIVAALTEEIGLADSFIG
jgi:hypothetical protein